MKHLTPYRKNETSLSPVRGNSRWDRYLGMTAAMTQVPVPTARSLSTYYIMGRNDYLCSEESWRIFVVAGTGTWV